MCQSHATEPVVLARHLTGREESAHFWVCSPCPDCGGFCCDPKWCGHHVRVVVPGDPDYPALQLQAFPPDRFPQIYATAPPP